jgi:hypothetical protein
MFLDSTFNPTFMAWRWSVADPSFGISCIAATIGVVAISQFIAISSLA